MPRSTELVTYALIACMVGLGGYLWLDRGHATSSEQTARAGLLLHVWRNEDVTRITVMRQSERIEIVREGENWQMTSPRLAHAEFLAVTALLNALGGARSERQVGSPSESDRQTFGLTSPRAVVEVAMKGVTIKVALGATVTAGNGDDGTPTYYVEVFPYGDDKGGVFVVAGEVARAIDRGSSVYREPSLLAAHKSMDFARVALTSAEGASLTLERGPHGEWRLTGGVPEAPVRADADVADALFGALGDLKADPFVPDTTKVDIAMGGTVDVDLRSGGKLKLVYGGACDGAVDAGAKAPDLVVVQLQLPETLTGCVPRVLVDRLKHPAAQYIDTHAFGLLFGSESAKISEIEAVTLEHAGQKIVDAERRGDGFHLRIPSDEQIARDTGDRFLRRIAGVSGVLVKKPIDASKLGLAPPDGRVIVRRRISTLTTGDTAADGGTSNDWEQIVEVGRAILEDDLAGVPQGALDGKALRRSVVYLHRLDDDAYLRVEVEAARALGPASAMELRSPNLLDLPPETIERIATSSTIAGTVPYEVNRTGAAFELISPPKLGADASAISELAHHLASLTCTRWAAERDDGTFGFASPQASIAIRRAAPTPSASDDAAVVATELAIEFGGSTNDGGVYARLKGKDAVCVLPEAKLEALLRPPVDRSIVGFDPTDAPRFTITKTSGTARTISFDGKAWHDGLGAGSSAADVTARKLADLVVGLRADRLLHLGAASIAEGFATPTLTIQAYDATGKPKKRVIIGASGKLESALVYYARIDTIDATYAVAREDIEKLLTGM